jgi:predicted transcriptional regulator
MSLDPAFLSAIGNAARFEALLLFEQAPASARELGERVGISSSAALQHVRKLEEAGLVEMVGTRRRRAFDEYLWRTRKPGWAALEEAMARLVAGQRDEPR